MFIDDKEVTGAPLRKVRLSQNVLHSSDRRDISLVVDVLQLMHFIRLIDNPVSFFKVDKFILLSVRCCRRAEWMSLSGGCS